MKVMATQGNWAITLNHKGIYYVRHLPCGSYLRFTINTGCKCKHSLVCVPVEENILKKFKLLTGVP